MYTVTQLARLAGTTADAVRHYTEIGLLRPQRDHGNNYRRYTAADLKRLCFIRTSRELGFSLDDIRRILDEADRGDSPCPQVRELYAQRLAQVEQDIARLSMQRDQMRQLLQRWKKLPDCTPTGDSLCHLIDQSEPAPAATESGACCHE
ncbi:MAG: MerR family transcriptional regulator [Pseudomonadota bacterium]